MPPLDSHGRCPRCEDAYLEATYLGATAVDRCPVCMGHWFRRGALAEFLKSPTLEYFANHYAQLRVPAVQVSAAAHCPTCEVALRRARPKQLAEAAVDVCPRCGGTWLDGIEIQRVLLAQTKGKGFFRWVVDTIEFVVTSGWRTR